MASFSNVFTQTVVTISLTIVAFSAQQSLKLFTPGVKVGFASKVSQPAVLLKP